MDVPIVLSGNSTFVGGVDELRQDLYLILKEPILTWYQSCSVGSGVMLHASDTTELKMSINDTLKQLKSVSVISINVTEDYNVLIKLNYNGRELEEFVELAR